MAADPGMARGGLPRQLPRNDTQLGDNHRELRASFHMRTKALGGSRNRTLALDWGAGRELSSNLVSPTGSLAAQTRGPIGVFVPTQQQIGIKCGDQSWRRSCSSVSFGSGMLMRIEFTRPTSRNREWWLTCQRPLFHVEPSSAVGRPVIRHPAICHLGEPPESDMAPLAGDVLKNVAGEYQPFNRWRSEIGDGSSLENSGPSYRANWETRRGSNGRFCASPDTPTRRHFPQAGCFACARLQV